MKKTKTSAFGPLMDESRQLIQEAKQILDEQGIIHIPS